MLIVAFIIYDVYVQRRNRKVVAVAAKTNEIVASLFPEAVRDRLFEDKKDTNKKASAAKDSDDSMIKKYLTTGSADMDDEVDEEEDFMYKSRPIADLVRIKWFPRRISSLVSFAHSLLIILFSVS